MLDVQELSTIRTLIAIRWDAPDPDSQEMGRYLDDIDAVVPHFDVDIDFQDGQWVADGVPLAGRYIVLAKDVIDPVYEVLTKQELDAIAT